MSDDSDFSPGDFTPQSVQAPDLADLPAIDPNDSVFQSPALPVTSIMGGVDFSGGDLPMITGDAGGNTVQAPNIGAIPGINLADPSFAPPALPPMPTRQSHSGAGLADVSQLPDSYRNSLIGRVWVNPTGQGLRGQDGAGNGGFGQSRSDGTQHGGADWINKPGQTVFAPTGGTIGPAFTYNGMGAVRINTGDGASVDALYTNPTVKPGDTVSAGDPIGTAANLRPVYGDQMTNHTHIQIKIPALNTVVDPTGLIPH